MVSVARDSNAPARSDAAPPPAPTGSPKTELRPQSPPQSSPQTVKPARLNATPSTNVPREIRDALIDAIQSGTDLAGMARDLAGGSLTRLAELFESSCDPRVLRNLLRLEQYCRAFRLEKMKVQVMTLLSQMAMGEVTPTDGSVEETRLFDAQRRAMASLVRINAFPTAREIRDDRQVPSPSHQPTFPDLTPQTLLRDYAHCDRAPAPTGEREGPVREDHDAASRVCGAERNTPSRPELTTFAARTSHNSNSIPPGDIEKAHPPRVSGQSETDVRETCAVDGVSKTTEPPPPQVRREAPPARIQLTAGDTSRTFLRGLNGHDTAAFDSNSIHPP